MALKEATGIEILNGWKEIAHYLGKGIRTAQRYERQLRLPVRRPAGKPKGSVIATKVELDAWISASPVKEAFGLALHAVDSASSVKKLQQQLTDLHLLWEKSVDLRNEMCAAQQVLNASIRATQKSLARMARDSQPSSRLLTFDPERKVN